METHRICSGCQKPLAPNAPDRLCPACLMKAGLDTGLNIGPDSRVEDGRTPFVAPGLAEVARLFPQLEILGLIGQGGMGAVYRARQKALDRVVALKILPPGIGEDPAFAERFTREAKALAKLNHPGIVTLYEFGQADGLFFFLMEFVDGVNLGHLMEVERISAREALAIVPQICDALQYAHDQGIVHRDIKPENILLDRQGRVKVADFGLAKLVGTDAFNPPPSHPTGNGDASVPGEGTPSPTLTGADKVMGTPQYMAPEQREHPTEVDHRADIYSLGVVFYQMLTGELPGKPIEVPSRKVHVDVRLDEVVLRALEKEPERRYQQASHVKTAVETIAAGPSVTPRPVAGADESAGEQAMEGIRRQVKGPAIGLLVTGILNWVLIPVGLLGLAWLHWSQPSVPGPRPFLPIPLLVITPLVLCSFMIFAALKMWRLQARGAALTGSVLAMIVVPGNMIGLPLGIWALVTLCRREVRAAFAGDQAILTSLLRTSARPHAAWPWIVATAAMALLLPVLLFGSSLYLYRLAGANAAALKKRQAVDEARLALRQSRSAAERARRSIEGSVLRPAVPNEFRIQLPQGEIELVGVSFHPSGDQPWWQPDGTALSEDSFELRGSGHSFGTGDLLTRQFVIRLTGLPENSSEPIWRLDPAGDWGSGEVYRAGDPAPGLHGISASLPKSAQVATIRVGIATDSWQTVAKEVPGGSSTVSINHEGGQWSASFPQVESAGNDARVLVVHTIKDRDVRVTAVDKADQEHTASSWNRSGDRAFFHLTTYFSTLPMEQVKEFRLQVRPYQWVEFRDVALHPKEESRAESGAKR